MGNIEAQRKAAVYLDQPAMYNWNYFADFSTLYFHYACTSGNAFNKDVVEKFFRKLPAPLGNQIHERWLAITQGREGFGIGQAVVHCFNVLQENCRNIQIKKQ